MSTKNPKDKNIFRRGSSSVAPALEPVNSADRLAPARWGTKYSTEEKPMASIFINKSVKPSNEMLSEALGRSYKYWEELKRTLESQYGKLTEEWKYYGASSGWTLKLLSKKRNLFFFAPCEKYFRIAFIFGDKAVSKVETSGLPVNIIQELKNAKRYVEGRGLRIEVKKQADVINILKLVSIKVST